MCMAATNHSANRFRYLLSYVVHYVTNYCNINVLRFLNVAFMSYLGKELYDLLRRTYDIIGPTSTGDQESRQAYLAHTALNICLFPPLVFFSGLYYTDLAAVVFVLFAIHACYVQNQRRSFGWLLALLEICLGSWALLLRQTNVFWVGLFPIGITVLRLSMDIQSKQKTPTFKEVKGNPAIEGKLP
jgi:alpha-1,2-glucosyltransferase